MTVNELIEVLKKFDGNLEVVNAIPATVFDRDAYSEDLDIDDFYEDNFEFDAEYNVVVFKAADRMPDYSDWNNNYPHGIPWKENKPRKATFMYNGRDDVTWDELPIEVRKHDYPYYFNKAGEDCYPYITDIR